MIRLALPRILDVLRLLNSDMDLRAARTPVTSLGRLVQHGSKGTLQNPRATSETTDAAAI